MRATRSPVTVLVLSLAVLLLSGGTFRFCLCKNVARVTLNRALWQEERAGMQRQRMLALAARILRVALSDVQTSLADDDSTDTMVTAIVAAEYYWRQGDLGAAAAALDRAATEITCPTVREALLLPGWARLAPNGAIALDGTMPRWTVRGDVDVEATAKVDLSIGSVLSFYSEPDGRRAPFQWHGYLDIPYHHTVMLRSRVQPGCTLRLETVIDGKNVRHLVQSGTGEWETQKFTVEGHTLQFVYILLDASEDLDSCGECLAEIDYVAFMPDGEELLCRGQEK